MEEFTFIVITYNHEKYIVDHLESIKRLIINFGNSISIDIMICDDASVDDTVKIANTWLENNNTLYRTKRIVQHQKNVGTVRNMLDAINQCKTDSFKILAGDDQYSNENLFALQESIKDNEVIITPLIPFSETQNHLDKKRTDTMSAAFDIIYKNQKHLKRLESINNYIPAPGAFYGKNVLRDKDLQTYISRYRLIEDLPTWHYILFESDKYKIRVIDSPQYILYRLGSGVSSNKNKNEKSEYELELERIRKDFDLKAFKYPKLINPYYIEVFLIRVFGKI